MSKADTVPVINIFKGGHAIILTTIVTIIVILTTMGKVDKLRDWSEAGARGSKGALVEVNCLLSTGRSSCRSRVNSWPCSSTATHSWQRLQSALMWEDLYTLVILRYIYFLKH